MINLTLNEAYVFLIVLIISVPNSLRCQTSFADRWEYKGIAITEPGYTVWGTSPILDDSGKVHLFVARWPSNRVDPDWRSISEIAHYVGNGPEGPFSFSDIALRGSGQETWDKYGMHNPAIHQVDSQYVLFYIANNNPNQPPHPANQKIGMALSPTPYGPWQKVGDDGLILEPPQDTTYWNFNATNGVNNPAFLKHPNGQYYLYFKSQDGKMGLAISEKLEGPYIQLPDPVTNNQLTVEDGYTFIYNNKIAILTTDNHGLIEEGSGLLWVSKDGITFDQYEKGFHHLNAYTTIDMSKVNIRYGPGARKYVKIERPQILMINEKPGYLYAPSGTNIYGENIR